MKSFAYFSPEPILIKHTRVSPKTTFVIFGSLLIFTFHIFLLYPIYFFTALQQKYDLLLIRILKNKSGKGKKILEVYSLFFFGFLTQKTCVL